jgi:hypothetical protein
VDGLLERTRNDADTWRKAFEDERAQRTLPASSHPTQPSSQPAEPSKNDNLSPFVRLRRTWRWLRSTG